MYQSPKGFIIYVMGEFIFKKDFEKEPTGLFIKMKVRKDSEGREVTYKALVDTGAQISGISEKVVKDLKLAKVKEVEMGDANGKSFIRPTFLVDLIIPGEPQKFIFPHVEVPLAGSTQGEDILLGMNVLNKGSFQFENHDGIYSMTFKIQVK